MPGCFLSGVHTYDGKGWCYCGEQGTPYGFRQWKRKEARDK